MSLQDEHQPRIYFFDRVLNATLLKLIPVSVKPNYVTVIRFLMIPWVALFLWMESYTIGLILFSIAALTDALDGAMARTRNQITRWGKIYDPVADKLLICAVVVILVWQYVNFYAAFFIIVLESLIVISALIKLKKGSEVQSNFWGKVKMCLQVAGVIVLLLYLLLNLGTLLPISQVLFYGAIGFAVVSLFTYGL